VEFLNRNLSVSETTLSQFLGVPEKRNVLVESIDLSDGPCGVSFQSQASLKMGVDPVSETQGVYIKTKTMDKVK
jgi:hypothetical protein